MGAGFNRVWVGGVDWGFRVGHGGSGGWVHGGFHQAVVLVDLAMGLRSACVGLVGWEGGGGEWVRPKAVRVLAVTAL